MTAWAAAAAPSLPPTVIAQLQQSAAKGGPSALLASLREVLKSNPELAASPDSAALLARTAASLAARFSKPDYGAISAAISAAAPAGSRDQIVGAVTDAVVGIAVNGPDQRLLPAPTSPAAAAPAQAPATETAASPTTQVVVPPRAEPPQAAPSFPATQGAPAYSQESEKRLVEKQSQPLRRETVQPYKVGSFFLYPSLIQSEVYDDNIFATRRQRKEDLISVVSPSVRLESDWARNVLNFEAAADAGYYSHNSSENYVDYRVSGEGRYDISNRSNAFGGLRYRRDHEDRESPDDVFGTVPTTFDDTFGYAGVFHRFNKLSMRLGGTAERLNYDNVPSPVFGVINNNDRDRKMYTGGLWLGYRVTPNWQPFVQGAFDLRRYDLALDDNGFHRNSNGFRLLAGTRISYPGQLQGELYTGLMQQNYDDPLLVDVTTPALGANLTWYPSGLSWVTAYVDRTIGETTLDGASSFINTIVGMGFNHQLANRLLLNVRFSWSDYAYQGIERTDKLLNAGAGLRYLIAQGLFVEAEYRFRHLDSTALGENFDRNQVFLRLGVEPPVGSLKALPPVFGAGSWPSKYDPSGFYVGAQGGYGSLDTALDGPRGPNADTASIDFGGSGGVWGVFGGYGRLFDRWYLGIEGEGDTGKTNWEFFRPTERSINVERSLSYAGSVRVGHMLGNVALLYGKVGLARTQFSTDYNSGGTLYTQDNTQTGLRLGAGAEIAATRSLFLRFDYTYTDYHPYDVNYLTGVDRFDNSESLFRVGAGYHF